MLRLDFLMMGVIMALQSNDGKEPVLNELLMREMVTEVMMT